MNASQGTCDEGEAASEPVNGAFSPSSELIGVLGNLNLISQAKEATGMISLPGNSSLMKSRVVMMLLPNT